MTGIRRQATRGVFWAGSSRVVRQALQIGTLVVVARLLNPNDFGLMALAILCVHFLMEMQEMGLGAALVQRKTVEEAHFSTIFWTGLVLSGLIGVGLAAAAPGIAGFFHAPMLAPMLQVLTVSLVLNALCSVHRNWFRRELDFRSLGFAEIVMVVVNSATVIVCALLGLGVWSLVWGQLAGDAAMAAMVWSLCPWRPQRRFARSALRELAGFGASVMGTDLLGFLLFRIDTLIIGRVLSAASLGIYDMAKQLVTLPARKFTYVINEVTFPVFSRAQDNNATLARWYLMTVQGISLIALPLLVGLLILAPETVRLVLGPKWTDAVVPIRWLAGIGMTAAISPIVNSLFRAKGRPALQLALQTAHIVLLSLVLSACAPHGINAVAAGQLGYALLVVGLFWTLAHRLIALRWPLFIRALTPAVLGSLGMAAVVAGARWMHALIWGPVGYAGLAGLVLLGAAAFYATVARVASAAVREHGQLAREALANIPMLRWLVPAGKPL